MAVLGISPVLISNAFLTHPISGVEGIRDSRSGLTSEDIYLIRFLFFLTQFHESVMDVWDKFAENQSDIQKQRDFGSRSRDLRNGAVRYQQQQASRLEGQRRQIESRKVETEGDVPLHAGRPHRAKRRFHETIRIYEGEYKDTGTRQLNLPV